VYANQFTYSYQQCTYAYTNFSYSYYVYTQPTYQTNNYDHVLICGYDYGYTGTYGGTTCVTADDGFGHTAIGPAADLVVEGDFSPSAFTIASGRFQVYVDGSSATISGNGFVNSGGYAGDFVLYGTDNMTSFVLNGNGSFTGVVIAPNAAGRLNGSGNNQSDDLNGMFVLKSEALHGNFNFHFDECLVDDATFANAGRWMAMSWVEIP